MHPNWMSAELAKAILIRACGCISSERIGESMDSSPHAIPGEITQDSIELVMAVLIALFHPHENRNAQFPE
jgi:hypothetical protein